MCCKKVGVIGGFGHHRQDPTGLRFHDDDRAFVVAKGIPGQLLDFGVEAQHNAGPLWSAAGYECSQLLDYLRIRAAGEQGIERALNSRIALGQRVIANYRCV